MKPDIDRLCKRIQDSRRDLENARQRLVDMTKQFAGPYYSENSGDKKRPLNLIGLYHQTMIRTMVPKAPRLMLSTFNREFKPSVRAMQDWANQEIVRSGFADTMREIVSNALFGPMGIAKVSIATPGDAAMTGWETMAGVPMIQPIAFDDFFFDPSAKKLKREPSFMGHRFRIPFEAAKKMLGKKAKDLQPDDERQFNEQGDERLKFLGRSNASGTGEDEFEDMVTLWEVYLPRHRLVLTLSDEDVTGMGPDSSKGESTRALLEQPWVGPYCGPYHFLGFQHVNGNPLPKGMIPDLIDLDEAANNSFRKIMNVVERMKEVGLVDGQSGEDGQRVLEADDGDLIKVQNLRGVQQMVFSGQHLQPIHAMAIQFKDLFSLMGGNVELRAGAAPQSKTLGQDRLLNENASVGVADMQESTLTFAAEVLEAWLWFHHHDPKTVQRTTHQVGGGREIVRDIYPGTPENLERQKRGEIIHARTIPFEAMNIRVDPYSLQHQTPSQKLNFLVQTVTQLIIPLMPAMQAQGMNLDLNSFMRKIGEYADQPDLDEILTLMATPPQQTSGGSHERTMAPSTTRTNVRENRSTQTEQGTNKNLIASSLGINTGGNKNTAKSA